MFERFFEGVASLSGRHDITNHNVLFTPQPLRAVGVLFSPMVSGWAGGGAGRRVGGHRKV